MLVISGATICGISAGSLWVAQGAYVSAVAGNFRQTELFGVFSALMKSSHFFGNLLIALILGKMSNFAYFSVLTFIGCKNIIKLQFQVQSYFYFCPTPQNRDKYKKNKQPSMKKSKKYTK